jgi:hypothetical protein
VQSIRVDLDKIDRVVNMVGELVITQSMLTQQMDETLRARYQELVRGLEVLAQTTRGLQDSVMAIRAQPVKSVFSRMPRLMRELAAKTGKKIKLETIGENTEIDKTIIEQLSDPLTHDPHLPTTASNCRRSAARRASPRPDHLPLGRAGRRKYPDRRRGRWRGHQPRTRCRWRATAWLSGRPAALEEQIDQLIFGRLRRSRPSATSPAVASAWTLRFQHQEDRRLGRSKADRKVRA